LTPGRETDVVLNILRGEKIRREIILLEESRRDGLDERGIHRGRRSMVLFSKRRDQRREGGREEGT
jgi:hypothetical protein